MSDSDTIDLAVERLLIVTDTAFNGQETESVYYNAYGKTRGKKPEASEFLTDGATVELFATTLDSVATLAEGFTLEPTNAERRAIGKLVEEAGETFRSYPAQEFYDRIEVAELPENTAERQVQPVEPADAGPVVIDMIGVDSDDDEGGIAELGEAVSIDVVPGPPADADDDAEEPEEDDDDDGEASEEEIDDDQSLDGGGDAESVFESDGEGSSSPSDAGQEPPDSDGDGDQDELPSPREPRDAVPYDTDEEEADAAAEAIDTILDDKSDAPVDGPDDAAGSDADADDDGGFEDVGVDTDEEAVDAAEGAIVGGDSDDGETDGESDADAANGEIEFTPDNLREISRQTDLFRLPASLRASPLPAWLNNLIKEQADWVASAPQAVQIGPAAVTVAAGAFFHNYGAGHTL